MTDSNSAPLARRYIVRVSRAKMPNSCMGGERYVHVALMHVDADYLPGKIADTSRGTVIDVRRGLYQGKSARCAAAKAIAELQAEADRRNALLTTEGAKLGMQSDD